MCGGCIYDLWQLKKNRPKKVSVKKIGGLRVQKRENAAYPNGIAAFSELYAPTAHRRASEM